jgi:hypothetical protein
MMNSIGSGGECVKAITRLGEALRLAAAVSAHAAPKVRTESSTIRVEFDSVLHRRVVAKLAGKETPLGPGKYRISDYEYSKGSGAVSGSTGTVHAQFEKHVLIRADPE